jgi:hypothetical protein
MRNTIGTILSLLLIIALGSSCHKDLYSDPALLSGYWRFDSIASIGNDNYQKDTLHHGDYLICTFYSNQTLGFGYGTGLGGNGTFTYDGDHHLTCKNVQRNDLLLVEVQWINIFMDVMNNSNSYVIDGNHLTITYFNYRRKAKFTRQN